MGVQFHTLGVYHKGTEGQTGRKTSPDLQGLPPAPWEGWEPARVEARARGGMGVTAWRAGGREPGTDVGEVEEA